jgi:hypothetical protein
MNGCIGAGDCARFAEALAEDPLALVSLLEFASSGDAICLRESIDKNSHATRTLAERSAPPGVRPTRETMVALDKAVHGQFGGITAVLGAQASEGAGTGVSDCVRIHLAPPGSRRKLQSRFGEPRRNCRSEGADQDCDRAANPTRSVRS